MSDMSEHSPSERWTSPDGSRSLSTRQVEQTKNTVTTTTTDTHAVQAASAVLDSSDSRMNQPRYNTVTQAKLMTMSMNRRFHEVKTCMSEGCLALPLTCSTRAKRLTPADLFKQRCNAKLFERASVYSKRFSRRMPQTATGDSTSSGILAAAKARLQSRKGDRLVHIRR